MRAVPVGARLPLPYGVQYGGFHERPNELAPGGA